MSAIPDDISQMAREAFVSGVDYGDRIPVLDAWRIGRALIAAERGRAVQIVDIYKDEALAREQKPLAELLSDLADAIRTPTEGR